MQKEKKSIINPLYIIGFWTIVAILFGIQSYIGYRMNGFDCGFWGTMFDHFPTFMIWALFAPIILKLMEKHPIINSKRVLVDLIVHFGNASLLSIISLTIIGTGRWLVYGYGSISFADYTRDFSYFWIIQNCTRKILFELMNQTGR